MRLREARLAKRLTQEALAEVAGIPAAAISDFEREARRPWPAAMRALAAALGEDIRTMFPEEIARRETVLQALLAPVEVGSRGGIA